MSAIVEGSWSNVLTVSQKGKHCGEIRKHFRGLPEREITDDLRERAESELRADPQCQGSYYDMLLVDSTGAELDFETNILTLIYPDQYLHVRDEKSGQEWICPIADDEPLNLSALIAKWAQGEFCGELELSGPIMPKLVGDYYAQIKTDGRSPDSVVCWTAGGFYLAEPALLTPGWDPIEETR